MIDTYLHPKWQSRIVDVLLDVFENTRFVMTTQSPLVILNRDRHQVWSLERVDGKIQASPNEVALPRLDGKSFDDVVKWIEVAGRNLM